jgi:glycosyltransferase involved in cell wall biosynthesis
MSYKEPNISIVIPMRNEEWSVIPLYKRLCKAAERDQERWEFIFVDDGSTDKTYPHLQSLEAGDDRVIVIRLERQYGLTQALQTGFDHALGALVVTLSGNLEDDPAEIEMVLIPLRAGHGLVVANRENHTDQIHKRRRARLRHALVSMISQTSIGDLDCLLRGYRRGDVKGLGLVGDLWRYIPVLLIWRGVRMKKLKVKDNLRGHGVERKVSPMKSFTKTILELMFLRFLFRHSARPIYLFGSMGLASILISVVSFIWMLWIKFSSGESFIQTPLPIVVSLFAIAGLLLLVLGVIAEMLARLYQLNSEKTQHKVVDTDSGR